ncbi:hypothetical protein FHQ18_11050 [Deferribacter autotrophicus]|uniref:DUF2802 domain-containing protein n=1 Tax=Deferribacter autotrophicus TaxID=500465 RepID=A0A5A8F645_9BACT|nr:hypothetical protein [Deferribacter autotrophicus]KAA0257098.1 hypothetical protein FHQ18_11050 [Deferribacter autotrophicus]
MNYSLILIIAFLLIGILYIFIFILLVKLKSIEKKLIDISYEDVQIIVNDLKELLVESERVSEQIDNNLREKEALLEDLVDLIDAKINRLEAISSSVPSEKDLKSQIIALYKSGKNVSEIAKDLNISVTEVNLVLKLLYEN